MLELAHALAVLMELRGGVGVLVSKCGRGEWPVGWKVEASDQRVLQPTGGETACGLPALGACVCLYGRRAGV